MKIARAEAFAYRQDPQVPPFDDSRPLVVFDGDCILCSRSMRLLARIDRAKLFRMTPAQGALGVALYRHAGLPTDRYDTYLLLANGRLYDKSDAIVAMAGKLPWPWRAASLLRFIPAVIRDGAYSLLARNRYRIFGREMACGVRDPELSERLL